MSEVDVSKCSYKFKKICLSDNLSYTHQRLCSEISIEDCYFKQLQQLKKENESLKGLITTGNKQETMLLKEIDKLQNANGVLQAILSDNAEVMKKQEIKFFKIKEIAKELHNTKIPFATIEEKILEIIESKEDDSL